MTYNAEVKIMNFEGYIKNGLKRTFIYKGYKRNTAIYSYPFTISIELTNRCNLSCIMCPRPKLEKLKIGDMDFKLFMKAVDDASKLPKREFWLVGLGEPLFYKKLPEAIRYVQDRCPNSTINLSTNATLLDKKHSNYLIDGGIDRLEISLNAGSSSTYKKLMGADQYDKVMENIKSFLAIRKSNKNYQLTGKPYIAIQILETQTTKNEVRDFIDFWKPLVDGNGEVCIRPLTNWGGRVDLDSICEKNPAVKRYPCFCLWNMAFIDIEGNVFPCCEYSRDNSELLLGNIKESSLIDIFKQQKIHIIRKAHLRDEYSKFSDCAKCNVFSNRSNLWFRNYFPLIKQKWI